MTLRQYKTLIRELPYSDQAFETKKEIWQQYTKVDSNFSSHCKKLFTSNTVKLSRLDVFNSCQNNFAEGLFTTVMWGYPRNMRGNNFAKILSATKAHRIECCFPRNKNLSQEEFLSIAENLKSTGIGLSTFSKLLYFFKYEIESLPCLILDSKIIEILNDKNVFTELSLLTKSKKINENNKLKIYVSYLRLMKEVSDVNNFKSDQLELFLFLMGRNLKSS